MQHQPLEVQHQRQVLRPFWKVKTLPGEVQHPAGKLATLTEEGKQPAENGGMRLDQSGDLNF